MELLEDTLPQSKNSLSTTPTSNEEDSDNHIFSEEEISNISALVGLLRQIRARLLRENVDLDHYRKLLGYKANH